MTESDNYTDELRRIKSLLIVTSLQKREDLKAIKAVKEFTGKLEWKPLSDLMIDPMAWAYAVDERGFDPKLVFCHPEVIESNPTTSLYYRGLCGLSLKAVRDYFGAVDSLEAGCPNARLDHEKVLRMARTYNTFICSIIENSTDWTLENGARTIVATMGITLDGRMRNKVGEIAEDRVRTLILDWLVEHNLIVTPSLTKEQVYQDMPGICVLHGDVTMRFGSEPDISFARGDELLVVVEIKGGIDPAGALERYGAATKSFQHATNVSPRCRNFYLGAVFTDELSRRITSDRLVEKTFSIIEVLDDPTVRDEFLTELFHHTLRIA